MPRQHVLLIAAIACDTCDGSVLNRFQSLLDGTTRTQSRVLRASPYPRDHLSSTPLLPPPLHPPPPPPRAPAHADTEFQAKLHLLSDGRCNKSHRLVP